MNSKAFHFEIHDLLNQFVAAYDDVVISRFNKSREEQSRIKVRYIHAPKSRVAYDLINKSQNLTLPVVCINVTNIARDDSRVFNKITGMYLPTKLDSTGSKTTQIRMPVPVNLGVSMSIITNNQTDLEQIASNFIPYTNPYIIICWKIPADFNLEYISEIRTEVLWDGSFSITEPLEPQANDKARFSADATFTIKGWLFPANEQDPFSNIYFVKNNFKTTSSLLLNSEEYEKMKSEEYVYNPEDHLLNELEHANLSGSPSLTNIFEINNSVMSELSGEQTLTSPASSGMNFVLYGKSLSNAGILLSSDTDLGLSGVSSLSYKYFPSLSGYVIDSSKIVNINNNILHFNIPKLDFNAKINFVAYNHIGWSDTFSINTSFNYSII